MSETDATIAPHACGPLRLDADRLVEVDPKGQAVFAVSRADVRRVAVAHGFASAHPLLQLVFGAALVAAGYWPAVHLVNWLLHGGTLVTSAVLVLPISLIGVGLAATALRRGHVLVAHTPAGPKRFLLGRYADLAMIRAFARAIETEWQIPVDCTV